MIDFKGLFRPGIIATRPYSPGKPICEVRRELGLGSVIKLASNENPEGPLPEVLEAIARAARDLIVQGATQPSGYTEPLLHAWRRVVKAA